MKLDESTAFNIQDLNEKISRCGIFTKMKAMKMITKMQMSLCKECLKKAITQQTGNIKYCKPCDVKLNQIGKDLNALLSKNIKIGE